MKIGKKRKEAVYRGVTGIAWYLVALVAQLVLFPLNILRWLADILWQFTTNGEGFSDDGYIPRAQKRLDGMRNYAYYGDDDASWRRR